MERRGSDRFNLGCECLPLPESPILGSKEDDRGEDVDGEQFYRYEVFRQYVSMSKQCFRLVKGFVP